ncbi:MAG: HAD-IA family hydrolase [Clostridia bacterium]|nr:HAD-IA family hydrolase [Clostridia bacterium]
MIRHLIYDFDGTISDSYPIFVRIVHDIAKDFGVVVKHSDEELLDRLLINVKACMEPMNFPCTPRERAEAFWHYQKLYYKDFKPFPEIESILQKAISLGKKNYIYTHSGDVVFDMLKNMGLDGYFSGVITAAKGFPQKPAPDALLYLCNTYQLSPEECLMIGDRDIDTRAGNNAGMKGCLWDAYSRYSDYDTDYKIRTLQELSALIETI